MTNNPTIDGVSRVLLAPEREMRVYIAGPMTGIEDYNFPAFNALADNMRAAGWHVENPADHGLVIGAEWGDYLRYDIGCLASCEAIMLLPGWTSSRGARLEVSIAKELGVVFMYADGAERDAPVVERQPAAEWCDPLQLKSIIQGIVARERMRPASLPDSEVAEAVYVAITEHLPVYEDVYDQLSEMIEPHVKRPYRPDAPLPASVVDSMGFLLKAFSTPPELAALQSTIAQLQAQAADLTLEIEQGESIELLREISEYLDGSKLNSVCSDSILHRKIKACLDATAALNEVRK